MRHYYGYHRINAVIRREIGWIVSDNLVHKVCKLLNAKEIAFANDEQIAKSNAVPFHPS